VAGGGAGSKRARDDAAPPAEPKAKRSSGDDMVSRAEVEKVTKVLDELARTTARFRATTNVAAGLGVAELRDEALECDAELAACERRIRAARDNCGKWSMQSEDARLRAQVQEDTRAVRAMLGAVRVWMAAACRRARHSDHEEESDSDDEEESDSEESDEDQTDESGSGSGAEWDDETGVWYAGCGWTRR
jgi:hypothetical protein